MTNREVLEAVSRATGIAGLAERGGKMRRSLPWLSGRAVKGQGSTLWLAFVWAEQPEGINFWRAVDKAIEEFENEEELERKLATLKDVVDEYRLGLV